MNASTVPNPDGSSTIYVHHITEGGGGATAAAVAPAPQPQIQPQPLAVFGAPFGAPAPPPPTQAFFQWGMPSVPAMPSWMPFGQPPSMVVVGKPPTSDEERGDEKTDEEKKKEWEAAWKKEMDAEKKKEEAAAKAKKKKEEEEKRKKAVAAAREPSRASAASALAFGCALALGSATIATTYQADRERRDGAEAGVPPGENEDYRYHRSVALGLTCAFAACHAVATAAAFYAAVRTRDVTKRREKCVESTFAIAGWIVFLLAFTMNLVVLVLGLNEGRWVDPFNVVIVVVLSIFSYLLMLGYSEMTRRW